MCEATPENWVDEHGDALFRYALMRIRDQTQAEDLVQETFLAALRSKHRFRGASSERTWLIGILRHKIADHLRSIERSQAVHEEAADVDPARYRDRRLKRWPGDPAKFFEEKEFWRVFHECTQKLPARLADAYYLRELAGLSTGEICGILEIQASNLALRIYRARAALRHCLDRNWFDA